MVLDDQVASAAYHGDVDAVKAWVAVDPSRVNDFATFGTNMKYTLLAIAVTGRRSKGYDRRRPRVRR